MSRAGAAERIAAEIRRFTAQRLQEEAADLRDRGLREAEIADLIEFRREQLAEWEAESTARCIAWLSGATLAEAPPTLQ